MEFWSTLEICSTIEICSTEEVCSTEVVFSKVNTEVCGMEEVSIMLPAPLVPAAHQIPAPLVPAPILAPSPITPANNHVNSGNQNIKVKPGPKGKVGGWKYGGRHDDETHLPSHEKQDFLNADLNDPKFKDLNLPVCPKTISGVMSDEETEQMSDDEEVNNGIDENYEHVDHNYTLFHAPPVPEKKEVEAPPVRRPVGRPRKCTAQVKRYADDMDEEIVDVESIQAKRPRGRAPAKAKPAVTAPPKRRGRKPNNAATAVSPSYGQAVASCSYATDSNGFVVRQAKNSAMKKIAQTNNCSAASRSKRKDHNDMERKRRLEMKQLFDKLKLLVPQDLLRDGSAKPKKNPSKNTILTGSQKHVIIINDERTIEKSLSEERSSLLRVFEKTKRKLRKILPY